VRILAIKEVVVRKASLRVEIILWLSFLMVIAYFDRVSRGGASLKGFRAVTDYG